LLFESKLYAILDDGELNPDNTKSKILFKV